MGVGSWVAPFATESLQHRHCPTCLMEGFLWWGAGIHAAAQKQGKGLDGQGQTGPWEPTCCFPVLPCPPHTPGNLLFLMSYLFHMFCSQSSSLV